MATESIAIVVESPPSTGITFAAGALLTAPVPPNTVIGTLSVEPPAWAGALVLSGADAASFTISAPSSAGVSELLNTAQLDARTYNLIASAAP